MKEVLVIDPNAPETDVEVVNVEDKLADTPAKNGDWKEAAD
jgi:hypothetical protein